MGTFNLLLLLLTAPATGLRVPLPASARPALTSRRTAFSAAAAVAATLAAPPAFAVIGGAPAASAPAKVKRDYARAKVPRSPLTSHVLHPAVLILPSSKLPQVVEEREREKLAAKKEREKLAGKAATPAPRAAAVAKPKPKPKPRARPKKVIYETRAERAAKMKVKAAQRPRRRRNGGGVPILPLALLAGGALLLGDAPDKA